MRPVLGGVYFYILTSAANIFRETQLQETFNFKPSSQLTESSFHHWWNQYYEINMMKWSGVDERWALRDKNKLGLRSDPKAEIKVDK